MQTNTRFFSKILLPSMVAVLCFLVAIYFFVIPNYRENLMDGKRETIRELTRTVWSVLHKLDQMESNSFTSDMAKKEAALIISEMRWGDELKDYFWITDTTPIMVMHPYRQSMNGMDLSDYRDPRGKNFFVDIVNIVKENGDGYIDYKWQWKDDSLTVVSKLSYVKAYEPWGWIVGTGIYIDDVNKEIENLTRKVVWISVLITLLIGATIAYLARRNYLTEAERQKVQERLRESMERYKSLVDATTDGVLMLIDNEIVYCNPYLLNLLGYSQDEFEQSNSQVYQSIINLLQFASSDIVDGKTQELPELSAEQKITRKDGAMVDVVVNRSKFEMGDKKGFIFAVKDVSRSKDVERELDLSMEKFKSIAGLMNIGVFRCTLGRQSRFVEVNPIALELLGYKNFGDLKDTKVQDLFDISSERKEVIRAITEGFTITNKLLRIKRFDGSIIPTLVSLFPVFDSHSKMVFCDGMLIDAYDHLCRDSYLDKNQSTLHLSASILLRPILDFMIPAPACNMNTPVSIAARMLSKSNSDLLVVVDVNNLVVGLITHSDISKRIVAVGSDISTPISQIMSAPVISVSEDEMVMDAFSLMMQNRISYIVVKSKDIAIYFYISLFSLSELRKDTPEYLINAIQKSQSIFEITEVMNQLPRLIQNLIESGTGVGSTGKLISKITDSITEKFIKEVLSEIGEPPAPFVFLALGSEGRREQTLVTDQDNAILFNPILPSDEALCVEYFQNLGTKVCNLLSQAGYPLCSGGVMAMNSDWCKSLTNWQKTVTTWISVPNPQEILKISIFFDFRPVYGDFNLANQLQKYCQKVLKEQHVFFYNLAQTAINIKVSNADSLRDSDKFDVKIPLLTITSIARLWSLRYGIGERNTTERFQALKNIGVFSSVQHDEFVQAFRFFMLLRLKNQLMQMKQKEPVGNSLDPKLLSEIEKITVKKALSVISDHQNRLGIEFRG